MTQYFNHSFHAVPEWMDDYSPFDRGGGKKTDQTKTSNPFKRPYPPPLKPKPQEADAGSGWAPGTGPPKLSEVSSRPNTLKADAAKRDAVVDAFRVRVSASFAPSQLNLHCSTRGLHMVRPPSLGGSH
jgi:hypothetical protein